MKRLVLKRVAKAFTSNAKMPHLNKIGRRKEGEGLKRTTEKIRKKGGERSKEPRKEERRKKWDGVKGR